MTAELAHGTLGEQIAKLIPMLSSTNDGEALAAVRAIGRKLKAAGRDWHWLAVEVAQLGAVTAPAPARPRTRAPAEDEAEVAPSRYRRAADAAARATEREKPQSGWTTLKRSEALAWTVLLDGQPWLKAAEVELVAPTRASLHDGLAFHLTAGQKRTLTSLIHAAMDRGLAP